jgi:Abnormal spindle-like microcephaly-assoc'd, ASPM-SPD-2-Hydin
VLQKYLIFILLGAWGLTGCGGGSAGSGSTTSTAPSPSASFSTNTLSFGNEVVGTTSQPLSVTLTNSGTGSLTISGISANANFAETNNCGSTLASAANCTINVTFTPSASGTLSGTLSFTDNASGSPQTVSLSGTGTLQTSPTVSLSTNTLAFGNETVGTTSQPLSVTLTNSSTGTVTISGIGASANFAETNNCSSTLASAANCTISVTFTPTASGSLSGTLSFTDNASGSPQTVSLNGTGTLQTSPTVSFSTNTLSFGDETVGTTSAPLPVTLTNSGTAPLTISGITASANFAETNNCGSTLAAAANCTINVTFTPTTSGALSGTISVTDNASGSPQTVSLSGTGTTTQTGVCVSGPCVTTYHNDGARDGVNSQETILTPSLFPTSASANFGLLKPAAGGATGAVDGLIYAQPLYLSGVAMASTSGCSGTQNIVLVATENNSVYAFTWTYTLSATGYSFSLTQCWMTNLNQAGEFAIPFTALPAVSGSPCNNIIPQAGITGTPVIDTSVTPPVMYVVTADQKSNLTYTYRLHAINVNSGTEVTNGSSAPYDLSSVFHSPITATQQMQRPGLALFNSGSATANIYVGFGSFCDITPYSGYLAGLTYNYSTQSFAPIGTNWVFDTEGGATTNKGGIWMSGAAPAVDSTGNVYVAVGNGSWNGTTEFGESAIKVATTSAGLVPSDFYTVNDYADLNTDATTVTLCSAYSPSTCPTANQLTITAPNSDFDLGSAGVILLSLAGVTSPVCGSNGELVAGGKEGVLYGICYSEQTGSTPQTVMGGLDGCGYDCASNSDPTVTACTESTTPGNGAIPQCFQGLNAGENQSGGSNDIFASSGIRGEAFWPGTAGNPENILYLSGVSAALEGYQASPATGVFNVTGAPGSTPTTYPYPGAVPSLSWDGVNPDTALLWAIDAGGYGRWNASGPGSTAATPAILVVYNPIPTTGTSPELTELWESSVGTNNAGPGAVKWTVPTIAGGLVFVPGGAPGYAPGPAGGTGVNCTAAALADSTTPAICGGMLSIYGKIHE